VRLDSTGQEIKIGSYVVYTTATVGFMFSKVERYTPKMVKLHNRRTIPHTHMIVMNPSMPHYDAVVDNIEQDIEDRARLLREIEQGDYK
jgi:hypothetical protein